MILDSLNSSYQVIEKVMKIYIKRELEDKSSYIIHYCILYTNNVESIEPNQNNNN